MSGVVDWMMHQGRQPSTWRGLVMLAAAFGVGVSPEQMEAIVALGMGVSGAIGAFFSDD